MALDPIALDRLALISDVHGNLTALEAVLDDIASRGITRILSLGEGVAGSPQRGPFSIQTVRVPYDVEAEIAVAHALGMPQAQPWEVELRTGVYRGLQPPGPRVEP